MSKHAAKNDQAGFALLVLLGIVGVGTMGIVLAVQSFLPPLSDAVGRATANLDTVATAAREAFVRDGAFPGDLDALATASGLRDDGPWRGDPFGHGQDLDYVVTASGLRVRSRGDDRVLGNADDLVVDVPAETGVRVRQRARLRLVRALLVQSAFRAAGSMSAAESTQMRTAMRDYAIARRQWCTATSSERLALTTTMATAAATITALQTVHGLTALPAGVTGAGGLFETLGLDDARAVDGKGQAFLADAVLGVVAVGNDGIGGTDDDM